MRFAYKGRGRSGETVEGVLEAATRAEAAAKLRRDGIAATSIIESKAPKTSPVKWIVLALIVAILGVSTLLLQKKESAKPAPKSEVPAKKTEVSAPEELSEAPKTLETPPPKTEVSALKSPAKTDGNKIVLPSGRELSVTLPPEGKTKKVQTHEGLFEIDSAGNVKNLAKRRLFKTPFENQLVGMAVDGGTFLPGLLKREKPERVMELLKAPVEADPDDTEEEAAKRAAVAELKQAALEYIENGGTFAEFVDALDENVRGERKAKNEALREITRLVKEDRIDEARARLSSFDASLQENGYSPLRLPPHIRKTLAR